MSQADREKKQDVIDGEIVAEFSDGTLLNLPSIPAEEDTASDRQKGVIDSTRRGFVLRLLLGGAAALTLGGSAALIYDQRRRREPQVVILPNGTSIDSSDVSGLVSRIAELEEQVAKITAERDQLISDLTRSSSDLEDARAQLADALALIEEYQGLLDLWQQLDDIGLDTLLEMALGVVSGALSTLLGLIAVLNTGLRDARAVLGSFVAALPGPQQGIQWLRQQVDALAESLEWLATQVQQAVEPIEPFSEMIASFVIWVLERLPFGIGAKARAGMEAMEQVVAGLPSLIEGVNTSVLDPLVDWFGEDERRSLSGILLNPIVEGVFGPAQDVLDSAAAYETTYNLTLADPARQALADRAAIREQIHAAQARLSALVST